MGKLIVVIGFVIAFASGWVVALKTHMASPAESQVAPGASTSPGPGRHGWLTTELNLRPDQQEQMKKIWSDTAHRGRQEMEDRRRAFRKERDDAIAALVRPEDRAKYEQIQKSYAEHNAQLERESRASFQSAVEQTKRILDPAQQQKYDQILKRQEAERASHEREQQNRRAADEQQRATSRPGAEK
jgi:LTXXQ motif family protein